MFVAGCIGVGIGVFMPVVCCQSERREVHTGVVAFDRGRPYNIAHPSDELVV
jgi:hypothetical protein